MAMRSTQRYLILDAVAAAPTTGKTIFVRDFRDCIVKIGTASSANLTVKCQGYVCSASNPDTIPDFSAAQSVANNWDYVQMVDLQNGNPVDGDT